MARQSLIPKRVKNTGIDILIAAALFGGAIILVQQGNKKFNILGKFVSGASSIGSALGQAVGVGVAQIPAGVASGAAQVFTPGGSGDKGLRLQLGLEPDTQDCIHFPFTNIPLPGSKCANSKPTNPNPNNPTNISPSASNPIGTSIIPKAFGELPIVASGAQDKTGFATSNRANIITTQKPTSFLPGLNQTTYPRDVRSTTLIRGQPLNQNLQSMLASGAAVQSIILNTAAGGTREIAGSPGLIARIQQNLRSDSR